MNIWNSSPQRELTANPLSGKLGADHNKRRAAAGLPPRTRKRRRKTLASLTAGPP
jgi:hypothetical protein